MIKDLSNRRDITLLICVAIFVLLAVQTVRNNSRYSVYMAIVAAAVTIICTFLLLSLETKPTNQQNNWPES